jgi:uncharacterized membrane protein
MNTWMTIFFAFWVFLLCASASFYLNGCKMERIFISIIFISSILTFLVNVYLEDIRVNFIVVGIDLIVWVIALIYVVRSDRYWPIWFAGFHTNTIGTELAASLFPSSISGLYINLAGAWALPALGVAAYGAWCDRKLIADAP